MKNLVKLVFGFIAISLIVISCDKVDNSSSPDENINTELSPFDGTIRNGDNDISTTGVVEVKDNEFIFITEYGSLNGSVNLVDDDVTYYEVSITEGSGDGIFENTGDLQGEMYSDYLSINGTSTSEQTINISGALTVDEANAQWEAERTKAQIIFTNLESCYATITLNGETLGPLQTHWREGGYCNTPYQQVLEFPQDADNKTSTLFCNEITLKMLDNSYKTFNICDIACFVVDKENSYNYTVSWDNGETTSGIVEPLAGGHKKYICLSNDGSECEYNDEDTHLIEIDSINIDYSNSVLPSGDENLLPYIDIDVFKITPSIVSGNEFSKITIGDNYTPNTPDGHSDTKIVLYIRNCIANGTYKIDYWNESTSDVAIYFYFGSNGIPFSSMNLPASGTAIVSDYDSFSKTCKITFIDVNISINQTMANYNIIFSGVIDGTFTTE